MTAIKIQIDILAEDGEPFQKAFLISPLPGKQTPPDEMMKMVDNMLKRLRPLIFKQAVKCRK